MYLHLTHNNNDAKYEPLSPVQVKNEMTVMFSAGADTSAHAMSFALLLIAMFPEVQEKMYQEIIRYQEILQKEEIPYIRRQDLNMLTYMDQVLNESLRLFPPTPLNARELSGPIKLSNGIILPTGTTIGIGIHGVQRSKKIWGPDAEKFDPQRFSSENLKLLDNFAYSFIPFAAGTRNCIGLKFARYSMKTVIWKVIQYYKLETNEKFEDIKCEVSVLAKKVGGWKIAFIKR